MNQDKTFDLEDLTDYFWKKVVFFELCHSSGLGGPGCALDGDGRQEEILSGVRGFAV